MCRHDVWHLPGVRAAMDRMKHVPVDREAPAAAYLRARRLLREGEAVCAFPEAGISYSYTVRSLMRGVASLARETGAPVVPGGAVGQPADLERRACPTSAAARPRPSLTRGRRVDVVLGEPVTVAPGDDLTRVDAGPRSSDDVAAGGAAGSAAPPAATGGAGAVAPGPPGWSGADVDTRRSELDSVPRSAVRPTWGPLP